MDQQWNKKHALYENDIAKQINKSGAKEYISDNLKAPLKHISNNISNNLSNGKLPAILIGNVVTSIISKKATGLLIDLGILFRDK